MITRIIQNIMVTSFSVTSFIGEGHSSLNNHMQLKIGDKKKIKRKIKLKQKSFSKTDHQQF